MTRMTDEELWAFFEKEWPDIHILRAVEREATRRERERCVEKIRATVKAWESGYCLSRAMIDAIQKEDATQKEDGE